MQLHFSPLSRAYLSSKKRVWAIQLCAFLLHFFCWVLVQTELHGRVLTCHESSWLATSTVLFLYFLEKTFLHWKLLGILPCICQYLVDLTFCFVQNVQNLMLFHFISFAQTKFHQVWLVNSQEKWICRYTLVFHYQDTVRLFGTHLVFEPIHLPKNDIVFNRISK